MISPLEKGLLAGMIFVLMLGMGCTLNWTHFKSILKHPKSILIGITSQFGVMPFVALLLASLLNLPTPAAIGLIMVGCTPGGTTSNMFTYFSKGDLALSVSMTVASTFSAVLFMPLLLAFYTAGYTSEEFSIPFGDIAGTLGIILIPVMIGMFIRSKDIDLAKKIEKIGSSTGIVIILFLIATWVPRNSQLLSATTWQIYAGAVGLGLAGFFFGYIVSKILLLTPRHRRTVALETGIQNTPLTFAIILITFEDSTFQNEVLHLPLLYALGIVITSALVTILFRKMAQSDPHAPKVA